LSSSAAVNPPHLRRLGLLALAVGVLGAGCRVMPGASPAASTPPASASPSGSAPPSPTADPAGAFFARFGEAPPPYRLLLEVAISGLSSGTARLSAEVAGADYRADVHVELAGLPARDSQVVFVDGTAYLRGAEGEAWVAVPDYRSQPPLNPFLLLDPADFSDEGADPAHGGLRRLHSSAWVEEDATLGYRQGGVRDVSFDVWLDAAGMPVEAELDFQLLGVDPSGQQVDLRYEANYTFSDVGADITIVPPVP
jgi:hypothetical protein